MKSSLVGGEFPYVQLSDSSMRTNYIDTTLYVAHFEWMCDQERDSINETVVVLFSACSHGLKRCAHIINGKDILSMFRNALSLFLFQIAILEEWGREQNDQLAAISVSKSHKLCFHHPVSMHCISIALNSLTLIWSGKSS